MIHAKSIFVFAERGILRNDYNHCNEMIESSQSIMAYLARKYFNNRCFVTHNPFKPTGFVLHHLWYINNDVIRKNYPKGESGRTQYLNDLKPLIEQTPFRFILITNGIHTRLDHHKRGLTRLKRENQYRLILALLMTRKN